MRTCVIFNPAARGGKARYLRRHLDVIAAEASLKLTSGPNDARRLAAEAVREGFETIVAAGGDGTINEVLNGIGDAPEGFERARLAVLPLGTVNVFARELRLPLKVKSAWEVIHRANETRIDLPFAEFETDGSTQRRYFAQLAGAGLDARAIELVEWKLKKKVGPLAYVWAGLKALCEKPAKITVTAGQTTMTGELVLIGNGRFYGGSFAIFPQADLRDGLLDIRVFPRTNWLTLLRCAPPLLLRGKLPASVAQTIRAELFTLAGSGPVSSEVDGEWMGKLPATFAIRRNALRVIVP